MVKIEILTEKKEMSPIMKSKHYPILLGRYLFQLNAWKWPIQNFDLLFKTLAEQCPYLEEFVISIFILFYFILFYFILFYFNLI